MTQGHHPLAVPIVIAVVLAFGSAIGLIEPSTPTLHARSVLKAPPPAEIDAGAYEALRDMVPADPALAPRISEAMRDGVVDEREMEAIAGSSSIGSPTALDRDAARRDLTLTLRAYAPHNA